MGENMISYLFTKYFPRTCKQTLRFITIHDNQNYIGPFTSELQDKLLSNDPGIQTLTISQDHNYIDDETIQKLSNSLAHNHHVTYLNLYHNRVTNSGAKYLSECLYTNKKLESLNLWVNYVQDDGIKYVSNALKNHPTLSELHVGYNEIKSKG